LNNIKVMTACKVETSLHSITKWCPFKIAHLSTLFPIGPQFHFGVGSSHASHSHSHRWPATDYCLCGATARFLDPPMNGANCTSLTNVPITFNPWGVLESKANDCWFGGCRMTHFASKVLFLGQLSSCNEERKSQYLWFPNFQLNTPLTLKLYN